MASINPPAINQARTRLNASNLTPARERTGKNRHAAKTVCDKLWGLNIFM